MTLVDSDRAPVAPFFAQSLARHAGRVAMVTGSQSITYGGLEDRVAAVAAELGAERRLVLLEAANTVEAVAAYLGALRGFHPVLITPADRPRATRSLTETYNPDVVLSAGGGWSPEHQRRQTVHEFHPDLALLLSTSGTTGSPKLVRLSRENLHSNATAIVAYLGLTERDRAITTLPMQYCYGLSVINSHLHAGGAVVLTDLSVVDRCFWDVFDSSGATGLAGVPHTFELLDRTDFAAMPPAGLRYVTQAGGRMAPRKVRRYAELGARHGWDFFVMYGQTEATARMAYLPPELASSHPHTIGLAIPDGQLSIDSPDSDGVGELVYRGPNVMLGYAERPADLGLGATVDRLHTGDLARKTPEGLYEVVGRRSRFIKPCGLRVDLDRVEELLAEGGLPATCTGDDDRLVVAVAAEDGRAGRAEATEEVKRLVCRHLDIPRSHVLVIVVTELPLLANGKPDYAAIRAIASARATSESYNDRDDRGDVSGNAPDAAEELRRAFAGILGASPSINDSFATLGGDSLSYVEASIRVEACLGTLPPDWHTTPIRVLASLNPRRRRRLARFDTTVAVRAAAITFVVATHADLWQLAGGAHVLLAIAGYNFARFHRGPGTMLASVARIALPSVCWIASVAAVSEKWRWPNVLLVNGWLGARGDAWGYWYIEAMVQILLPLAMLFAIPAVRSLNRRMPFALAMAAVATGLLIRFDVVVEVTTTRTMSRPHEIFWLFAIGWAAVHALTTTRRLIVTALAVAGAAGFFGSGARELVLVAGILGIIWIPSVPLPRVAGRAVGWVAGASLYIYLIHFQVYPPLLRQFGPAAAVVGSLLAGVLVWRVARRSVMTAVWRRVTSWTDRSGVHVSRGDRVSRRFRER